LGGGSSDAAAALVAANRAWKLNWNREQLGEVAAELGSDVPFFLAPRSGRGAMMSVCRGRGEIVQPLTAPAGLHFVVARPATGLSTPVVYARCRTGGSSGQAEQLALALRRGDQRTAMSFMFNRLESAAAEISPGVEELATQFRGIGALAHQLSGSGSARFGWFASRRAAQRAASLLRAKGVGQVWQAQAI